MEMPDFRDHFTHRVADLLCSDRHLGNSHSRLDTEKWQFLGQMNYQDFPKTAEHRGQPTAVWRDPISNTNRGWGFPIFVRIILALSEAPS